jgi:hypothetical protein
MKKSGQPERRVFGEKCSQRVLVEIVEKNTRYPTSLK